MRDLKYEVKSIGKVCALSGLRGWCEGVCIGSAVVVGAAHIATGHYIKGAIYVGSAIILGIETSTHYLETRANEIVDELNNYQSQFEFEED